MKKIILLSLILTGFAAYSHAASAQSFKQRQLESFADTGKELSFVMTSSGTAGIVSTVTIPTNARGFKLFPRSTSVRFSVGTSTSANSEGEFANRVVVAIGSHTLLNIQPTNLTVGGIAKADLWETRFLPADGRQRDLYIRTTGIFIVVDIEFF